MSAGVLRVIAAQLLCTMSWLLLAHEFAYGAACHRPSCRICFGGHFQLCLMCVNVYVSALLQHLLYDSSIPWVVSLLPCVLTMLCLHRYH